MFIINNRIYNPYFNIASEEHYLKNFEENIFFLYQNKPSLIIGKHQNTFAEINYKYANNNNIPVIRRLSGGGTVYHDLGNLNFTFIINGEEGKLIDFEKYTKPIIDVLNKLNINAKLGERNNIFIDDYKISGNAEHVHKKRILHHGTLLFNSNLSILNKSIENNENKHTDNAVKSVKANVTNISNYLNNQITINDLNNLIIEKIKTINANYKDYELNNYDKKKINDLVYKKYNAWEWNYGYSPKFKIDFSFLLNKKEIMTQLNVQNGCIIEYKILNKENNSDELNLLNCLINTKLDEKSIELSLNDIAEELKNKGFKIKEFVSAIL